MSKIYCKYHLSVPARWRCEQCNIDLCASCIKREYTVEENFICPVCGTFALSLGSGNAITPFWQRLGRFFLYPANASSLTYITVLAILTSLFLKAGVFALIAGLAIGLMSLRYAYAVLNHTALGHMTPPSLNYELITGGLELPIKQFFVFIMMGSVLGFVSGSLDPIAAVPLWLLIMLIIPASVMVLAIENSFFGAVNPIKLISIVKRIGPSYLLLYAFLLFLWGGSSVVMELVYGKIPDTVFLFVSTLATMYFLVIMFNMMGYVIYQYHEPLGFSVEVDVEDADGDSASTLAAHSNPIANEAAILINEGKIDRATSLLQEEIKKDQNNIELHNHYHRLLLLSGKKEELIAHAHKFIGVLMAEKKLKQALDIYQDCLKMEASFQLQEAEKIYPLAKLASDLNKNKFALAIMNGFAKKHPGHADIPQVYMLAAKILCEKEHNDVLARQILENLRVKYPGHPLLPEITQYLAMMDRLRAASGGSLPTP